MINKKNIFLISFSLLLCFLFPNIMFAQKVISSEISKDSIMIGDQIEWITKINVPRDVHLRYDTLMNPVVKGVETLGGFKVDTLGLKKKSANIQLKAIITSFDSGDYTLPRRMIYLFKDGELVDTLAIQPQTFKVSTVAIDTAKYKVKDIKQQFKYPLTFREVWPWATGVIVVICLVLLIMKIINNMKENKNIFGKPIVVDPPHIVALRKLDRLRGKKLWQNGKSKIFYSEITDTMREYLEGRYKIKAKESTTNEIFKELSEIEIEDNLKESLHDLFVLADLVKFAKMEASEDENKEALPTAVKFINSTFLQQTIDEEEGEHAK